jgi:hypothetical protein
LVRGIIDANWMAQNSIFVLGVTNRNQAVAESLAGNDILGHVIEIEELGFVDPGLWDDTSWGTLMDDFGS